MEAYLGTLLGPSLAGSGHCRLPSEAIDSACPSLKNVIDDITGGSPDHGTNSFTRLRTKALDNVRNWKRDVTKNTSMFKPSSRTSLQTLYELTNSTFFRKMQERFNPQNYFDCFHYIKSTINVDQSSELGIYYMKSMYANMLAASRTCIKGGQTLKEKLQKAGFSESTTLQSEDQGHRIWSQTELDIPKPTVLGIEGDDESEATGQGQAETGFGDDGQETWFPPATFEEPELG
ncbi:hypothetical protein V8E54_004943 [Elaphomyces granulatus]